MIRALLACGFFLQGYAVASVTLLDNPVILADQNGNGVATILISKGAADTLNLRAAQFVQALPAEAPAPAHEFILHTDSVFTPASAPAAQQTVAVRVAITGLMMAGRATAALMNDNVSLGTLTAFRNPGTLNITIDAPAGTVPEAVFSGVRRFWFRGIWGRTTIQIKNSDAVPYRFHWRLEANGISRAANQNVVDLPANSSVFLDITDASPDTLFAAAGTLKYESIDGQLELQPEFDAGPKVLPLNLRMDLYPPGLQLILNGLFIFVCLMLGGVVSVAANCYIPNSQRALALRKRVKAMADKLAGIGSDLDSQWIALLDSHVHRMHNQLVSMFKIFPAYATLLDETTVSVGMYEKWLDTAYDVSIVLRETAQALQRGLSPTMLESIRMSCDLALSPIATGFTTDVELQAMKAGLEAAEATLRSFRESAELPDLAKTITAREGQIKDRIPDLKSGFPELTGFLDHWAVRLAKPLTPAEYRFRDTASLRAAILLEYDELLTVNRPTVVEAPVSSGAAAAQPAKQEETAWDRMNKPETRERLLSYLRPDTYESLRIARIFVQEMHQDFYEGALKAEIAKPAVGLRLIAQPDCGEVCSPVRFSVRFDRQELQEISACQEWTGEWTFGDRAAVRPGGWDAYHSFAAPGTFSVDVMMRDLKGNPVLTKPLHLDYKVIAATSANTVWWRLGPESRLEAGRLLMIMTVAMAGIFATARTQISNLPWPAAVATVVGLGFGADTLKNLITRKNSQ